ncbi:MAG: hypothetical protein SGILL_003976, partial [Bacillariaceae sp.]
MGGFSSLTPSRLSFPTRRASPLSAAKIRPRGFSSPPSDATGGVSLSRLGNAGRSMPTPESAAVAANTRLIFAPTPKPKLKLALGNATTGPSPLKINGTNGNTDGGLGSVKPTRLSSPFATPEPVSTPVQAAGTPKNDGSSAPSSSTRADVYYQQALGSPNASGGAIVATSALPTLTKEGYTCSPSIEELEFMDPGDLAAVSHFSVSRPGVGKVEWEGAVDVRGANLNKIVLIEPGSVSVYEEEEQLGRKPEVGSKLNRPAVLTLEKIFPAEGASAAAIEKFCNKVARKTKKMDAEFIDYDPSTGEWKLRVHHFSRYALDDSDDESDDDVDTGASMEVSPPEARLGRKVDFQVTSPRQPRKMAKIRKDTPFKPRLADREEYSDMVSDEDMADDDQIETEADQAYAVLQQSVAKENELLLAKKKIEQETTPFPEEAESVFDDSHMSTSTFIPTFEDMETAASMPSITSKLLGNSKSRTTSSRIDYGLRMGRSFRVAWAPDGSFLSIKKDGTVARCMPQFVDESNNEELAMLHAHKSSCQQISTNGVCPLRAIIPTRAAPMNKVLDTYTNYISDESSIESNSFSLLSVVNQTRTAKASSRGGVDADLNARCMFAFMQFLIASCSHDVVAELASKGNSVDFKSLLAAISSGNLKLAAKTAEQAGVYQLSILLTCPEARGSVSKEMRSWKNVPEDLKRIYRIIGGDVSMESKSKTFDWKRLMAMSLAYSADQPRDLETFIQQYEAKIASGDAPFPSPSYLGIQSSNIESVLYKLMNLEGSKDVSSESLSAFINPLGYTGNPHDFNLAFHLASCLSLMPGQPRLAPEEEESLIDGLKAQLLSVDLWEWAVYLSLFIMTPQVPSSSRIEWRLQQVRALISQHYDGSEGSKREFLETIGVPTEWFEESLAWRSKNEHDAYSCIQHTVASKKIQEATEAFEKT